MVKSDSNELDEALIRENMAYIEANPHERWLRRVFGIAGAEYGRIDYGMRDGAPQVWEINLNPTIGMPPNHQRKRVDAALEDLREREREAFHSRLRDAFVALDRNDSGEEIDMSFSPALWARLAEEAAGQRRRERVLAVLRSMYHRPRAGWLFRTIYHHVVPRL